MVDLKYARFLEKLVGSNDCAFYRTKDSGCWSFLPASYDNEKKLKQFVNIYDFYIYTHLITEKKVIAVVKKHRPFNPLIHGALTSSFYDVIKL